MRKLSLTLVLVFVLTGVVWADEPVQASGRGFFGFAGVTDESSELLFHMGGGGEGKLVGGLGVTADLGYLFSREGFSGGIGLFSPGLIYHFNRDSRTTPFLTGGYTLLFRDGVANLGFGGGGVDHWFKERLGLRFEFRLHVRSEGLAEGRIAFLFR